MRKKLGFGALVALVAGATVGVLGTVSAGASSSVISFEQPTYSAGDINGQDGWSKTGAYDASVVDATGYGFAGQALRMSDAVTSGSFGDQAFSPSVTDEAGETSAEADGMSGGARQRFFEASWTFASTVPGAEQPGMHVVASPDRGDGARMSWVQMQDLPSGLEVDFYDYQAALDPGCVSGDGFVESVVASGLDRTVAHTIDVTMDFVDGAGNDVVNVVVDGASTHTGTSWEDYFRDCASSPTRTVDSMLFRESGDAHPDNAGNGFLIDDLAMVSSAGPTVVDDDGQASTGDCDSSDTAATTVQRAVDNAATGGTVTVCPGTYTEQVSVDKDLTIHGTDEGTTVVKAPASLVAGAIAGRYSVVEVSNGASVGLDGLTVSGPGPSGCGSLHYGVLIVGGASVTANGLTVSDIRDEPFGGCQNGVAILAGNSSTEIGHFDGQDVTLTGYQKAGLVTKGAGSSASLQGSTVQGAGATAAIAQNGVQASGGATATIENNEITGHECDNASCGPDFDVSTQSIGVLLFGSGGGTVAGNTITGNDLGVYNDTNTGAVTVSGNTVASRYENVFLGQGEATISGNTLTGSNIGVMGETGPDYSGNTVAHVVSNTITGAAVAGIQTSDLDSSDGATVALDASFNRIVGNGTGASALAGTTMSAARNWWGCNGGPGALGCDGKSGTSLTSPWLILTVSRDVPRTATTAVITADLNHDKDHVSTSSLGHVPDGTPVAFSTNHGLVDVTSSTLVNGAATTVLHRNGEGGTANVSGTVDNQTSTTKVKLVSPKLTLTGPTSVNESDTTLTYTAHLSQPTDVDVTASYNTEDGNAKVADGDYDAASGTVTIPAGSVTATFQVTVHDDARDEANETFGVGLSSAMHASGAPSLTVTIHDNDAAPSLSIDNVVAVEGTNATFTVTLSAVSGQTVNVNWATVDDTAVHPKDFVANSGTLTFHAGQTTRTITVPVKFDGAAESAEVFHISLSGAVNGTISDGIGDATIPANVS